MTVALLVLLVVWVGGMVTAAKTTYRLMLDDLGEPRDMIEWICFLSVSAGAALLWPLFALASVAWRIRSRRQA